MYHDNEHYGHGDILRRYCGTTGRPQVGGHLQHGWTVSLGLSREALAEPVPKLLWSDRVAAEARALGYRQVHAIGSPFLYLPPLGDQPSEPARGPRSLLVIPFHGWERERLAGDMTRYADSLDRLVAEGFGPITVCLYWAEYEDPTLREVFAARGHRVVTNGHRDRNPTFLYRQRALIAEHAYATSNRICTAAFYVLALGRRFFLYGPPMGLSRTRDPSGEEFAAWQAEHYRELLWESFGDRCHASYADRELGRDSMRGPEELRALLGWGPGGLWTRAVRQVVRAAWVAGYGWWAVR